MCVCVCVCGDRCKNTGRHRDRHARVRAARDAYVCRTESGVSRGWRVGCGVCEEERRGGAGSRSRSRSGAGC